MSSTPRELWVHPQEALSSRKPEPFENSKKVLYLRAVLTPEQVEAAARALHKSQYHPSALPFERWADEVQDDYRATVRAVALALGYTLERSEA